MTDTKTQPPVLKFKRKRETNQTGLSIWDVPGAGLYRVLEINTGKFTVSTLAPLGWIELIHLDSQDGVKTSAEAFQTWLQIQTPPKPHSGEGS